MTARATLAMDPNAIETEGSWEARIGAVEVLFGAGREFLTPFEAGGPIRRGALEGDLVVRAGGDPLWGSRDAVVTAY